MSQYHRNNPDAPVNHDWFKGAPRADFKQFAIDNARAQAAAVKKSPRPPVLHPVTALITIEAGKATIASDKTVWPAAYVVPGALLQGEIMWRVISSESLIQAVRHGGVRYARAVPEPDRKCKVCGPTPRRGFRMLGGVLSAFILAGCSSTPRAAAPAAAAKAATSTAPATWDCVALTVQASASLVGPWIDLPISWVLPISEGQQYFRLFIEGTNAAPWISPPTSIIAVPK